MVGIGNILKFTAREGVIGVKKYKKTQNFNNLHYSSLKTDCIILKESPLDEFKNYTLRLKKKSKKNVFQHPESIIEQYSKNLKEKPTLIGYKNFIFKNAEMLNVSEKEYYELVDEIARKIQKEINQKPRDLRKEFVDNAGKIHKWAEIFATQHFDGKNIYSKFYNEKMYNNALKEYTEFVEKITGKKFLIGCTSRMNFLISALGMFNNPRAYKNVDYFLFGHGKNSSLITNTQDPLTWRFTDNNKSIYKFIEENVPIGKKVMVFCCETDAVKKSGRNVESLVDRKGTRMLGIGEEVLNDWNANNPVKLCESGIRHVIGHIYSPQVKFTDIGLLKGFWENGGFTLNIPYPRPKIIYYDLDFNKFKKE